MLASHYHQVAKTSTGGFFFFASYDEFVVPNPLDNSLWDDEFGLPIYLLVGILALLLNVASNTTLIAQTPPLPCHKPNSNPI